MLLELMELIVGLSTNAQLLLILCLFFLALFILSIVIFYPVGARRLLRFFERLQGGKKHVKDMGRK